MTPYNRTSLFLFLEDVKSYITKIILIMIGWWLWCWVMPILFPTFTTVYTDPPLLITLAIILLMGIIKKLIFS